MREYTEQEKKKLYRKLLWLFIAAFLMSNGPGLYPVNLPLLVAGVPILYLWGMFWAIVQIWIIVYASQKLWSREKDVDITPLDEETDAAGEVGR